MLQSLPLKIKGNGRFFLEFLERYKLFIFMMTGISVVLGLAEWAYPYYFLQDDNRNYFLAYFIHNYDSLAAGELAFYNFHQFMGIPSLAQGQSAVLYPLSYLSVFISRLIFDHPFAAIDVLVIIHILIGAAGCYFLARELEFPSGAAAFTGISWSLNSYVIFVSNSWVPVSGLAAYWPWMVAFGFRQLKQPRPQWTGLAIMVRLLLFYQGHIQFFIYAVIFEFLTLVIWVRLNLKQNLLVMFKSYIPSYISVLLLSMPLLLPMWNLMQISYGRSSPLPFGNFADLYLDFSVLLRNLVFPFQDYQQILHPVHLKPTINLANLGHAGYLTLLLVAIGTGYALASLFRTKRIHSSQLGLMFSVLLLISACWTSSLTFNYLIYQLPILNRFRWPFKVMIFFDFYLVFLAAVVFRNILQQPCLEQALRTKIPQPKYRAWISSVVVLAVLISQLINYAVIYAIKPFQHFGYMQNDLIPLNEPLSDILSNGRILSLGFDEYFFSLPEGQGVTVLPTLGFNAATLTGLDYFAGYDLMVPDQTAISTLHLNHSAILERSQEIPVDYLRACGVNWYLVPSVKADHYHTILRPYGIEPIFQDSLRTLFLDHYAQPIISKSDGSAITDHQLTANSISLVSRSLREETIRIIYQFDPYLHATVDGKSYEMERIEPVGFSITLPPGEHHIRVAYINPWFRLGLGIALAFLMIVFFKTVRIVIHPLKF